MSRSGRKNGPDFRDFNIDIEEVTETIRKRKVTGPEMRIWWAIELFSLYLFYFIIIALIATLAASTLNVQHVYHVSSARISQDRRIHAAFLQQDQCRLYLGKITPEEERVAKSRDAHILPVQGCIVSDAYLKESEYIQIAKACMNHYAICEAGRCDEAFKWMVNNIAVIGLTLAFFALLFLYMFGNNRANQSAENRPIIMYHTPGMKEYGQKID